MATISSPPPLLDVAVHFVEESGQALHFVEDDGRLVRESAQFGREAARIGEKALEQTFLQQIEAVGVREEQTKPSALAGAARAEEKKRATRSFEQTREQDCSRHVAKLTDNLPASKAHSRPGARSC